MGVIQNNQKYYYAASFLAHTGLLLLVVVSIQFRPVSLQIGDEQTNVVNAYSFNYLPAHSTPIKANKAQPLPIEKSKATVALSKTPAQSAEASSLSRGEKADELLSGLHAAIQREQHYPESAIQLEQQGRVTVAFTLFPNGTIQNLHLVKSSGIDRLDAAGLAAVNDAVPFNNIEQFLQTSQDYTIDVVFALS